MNAAIAKADLPPALRILDRCARGIDSAVGRLGGAVAWLTLVLVLMVAGDVVARYIWHTGSVAEQELEWHILAVIAMLSASYTLQQNEHVRVDIFYQHYPQRLKEILEVVVALLVVVPTMGFLAWVCIDFVQQAYAFDEGSPDPGGLPYRFVIKAFVPLGFGLVAVQALAGGVRDLILISTHQPVETSSNDC